MDRDYKGKIPTLEEVFDFCKDKLFMNIEIKDDCITKTTDILLPLIEKHQNQGQLSISGFNHKYFNEINRKNPDIQFQFTFGCDYNNDDFNPEVFKMAKRGTINMYYATLTEEIVKLAHENGFGVLAWCDKYGSPKTPIAENEETFYNLMKMGVDVVCANKVDLALKARKKFIEDQKKQSQSQGEESENLDPFVAQDCKIMVKV